MFFNEYTLIPLNEVYFGKTKELLAAEQQLDKFRRNYMGRYIFNTRINSDPELLKFDRMMEKIFGFGCFTLHIHNQAACNAFTQPIDYRYDFGNPSNNIITDENGFKFRPEFDYACILGVYSGLIFNPDFTTPEIMAIILHEVGHNFNSSINKPNGTLLTTYLTIVCLINVIVGISPQGLISMIKNTNAYRRFMDVTGKSLRESNALPVAVYDIFIQTMAVLKNCYGIVNDALRILTLGTVTGALSIVNGLSQFLMDPVSLVFKLTGLKIGYTTEESADNFATMYGYGPDLSSAIAKRGSKPGSSSSIIMSNFDKIPIISTIMHFNELPGYLLLTIMDEHPNSISRVKDQMNMLKRELETGDIDPKMAKYIKEDIKACEDALEVLVDCSEGMNDPYLGRKIYNSMIIKGPDTKRSIFGNRFKFEEYDKAFKNNRR